MHDKFCPNCGHKVLPNAQFCGNCGYRFKTNPADNSPFQPKVSRQAEHINYQYHPHHFIRWTILAIVVILIGFGGYSAYQYTISSSPNFSQSSSNSSQSTQIISKSTAQNKLDNVWACTQDEADNDDDTDNNNDSLSDFFTSENVSYNQLYDWAKDMYKADSIDGLGLEPIVKSVSPISNGTAKVTYLVKYDFKNAGSGHHYQGFIWHAKFKKLDGNWLISSNKANKQSSYDHD